VARPNPITLDWFRFFLTQNPQWDWMTITRGSYEQLWDQSVEQFSAVIATDNADLRAFRDRGGRIVMWHGQSDPLIYPGGSIDYYKHVIEQMGGAAKTAEFMRFFLAPGVGHCGGGVGPAPTGQLAAVIDWVESGKAPEALTAIRRDSTGTVTRSRPLCRFPSSARYKGQGSTDDAANFACRAE
jgi:feruloyl esterase